MSSGEHAREFFENLHLTYRPAKDDYPADRCGCQHLVYPDETPGGPCRCRGCACARHESANRPASSGTEETP